jgi:serine phosphatase RsbU (regulator of sigma subunit)
MSHSTPVAWPRRRDYKRSIRLEFSLFMTGVIVVLMAVTGYFITDRYVTTVTGHVAEKLIVQARSFSGSASKHILAADGPDALLLNNVCRTLADDTPDLFWTGIAGPDHVFLAHTEFKQVVQGEVLRSIPAGSHGEFLRSGETYAVRGDTVFLTIPIREKDVHVGTLALAASARQISEARSASILTVGSITVVMILLGLPLLMFVLHRKLQPVSIITGTLQGVDLESIALDIPVRTRNEFGYLAETLRVMGDRLRSAQGVRLEKERLARELEIAREVQASMLPKAYPRAIEFDFAGAYRSAREVGGDYYDFVRFDRDHLGVLVADVSGKSLPGMLVMLLTRDLVKTLTRTRTDPAPLLCELNRELLPSIHKGKFVTMSFGVLHQPSGRFRFASAGHNPLIWMDRSAEGHQLIRPRGYPLGMMAPELFDARMEQREITLSPGDLVVQYTDGVNEALNDAGEEFGMERLVNTLNDHRGAPTAALVESLLDAHRRFVGEAEQYDDITILAMRWIGPAVGLHAGQLEGVRHVS